MVQNYRFIIRRLPRMCATSGGRENQVEPDQFIVCEGGLFLLFLHHESGNAFTPSKRAAIKH